MQKSKLNCRDRGFTTTCAISVYHRKRCELESRSRQGVHGTTLCVKVCQWFASGRWFSPDRHDITEILLKVALNTINQNLERRVYVTTQQFKLLKWMGIWTKILQRQMWIPFEGQDNPLIKHQHYVDST